jgi:hypothetical protein
MHTMANTASHGQLQRRQATIRRIRPEESGAEEACAEAPRTTNPPTLLQLPVS